MNTVMSEPDDYSQISWKLLDHLDIQKGIREKGGIIDMEMAPEDVEYLRAHPEEFPDELKNKSVFLWNTLEIEEGIRRITMVFWFIDEVETYSLVV